MRRLYNRRSQEAGWEGDYHQRDARSGFAHLHPVETDLAQPPDALRPELNFKITIPQSGRYVIWAQVNIGGEEEFIPFWIEVLP